MSEDRYDKLLNAAIVLLIVSATVLGYSVYKSHFESPAIKIATDNSILINNLRDSLKNVYSNTITSIDNNLVKTNSENNPELQAKYQEVESLKAEISKLLVSNGEGATETAQQKIQELQLRVENLQIRYEDAASQNKKLQDLIKQLTATRNAQQSSVGKSSGEPQLTDQQIRNQAKTILAQDNNTITDNAANLISKASDMQFFATESNGETLTTKSNSAEKFKGSFVFKHANTNKKNDDLYIVIIQPDGKTIKGPSWDIGVFNSDEGKKVFSKKIPVSLDGENKKINFEVAPDDFMPGPYKVEIWYQSHTIGTLGKNLL